MNYKTIQLALRELLHSHAEDGWLVLQDLNRYIEEQDQRVQNSNDESLEL